jgi:hypothetical protein
MSFRDFLRERFAPVDLSSCCEQNGSLTTARVLRQEAQEIHPEHNDELDQTSDVDLYRVLNGLKSAALCLSGGGIRSAAFGLGVIQALATHPRLPEGATGKRKCLLEQFHYLSSVSGGGYIGSWLSAWCAREGVSFDQIRKALVGRDKPDVEPPPITWLRSYSNYLTPRLGVTSADFWAIAAVYLRNLITNWLVILPFLAAAILALKIVVVALTGFSHLDRPQIQPGILILVAGIIFLFVALRFMTAHRPSRRLQEAPQVSTSAEDHDRVFLRQSLLWSLLSAVAFTQVLAIADINCWPTGSPRLVFLVLAGGGAAIGGLVYAASWLHARPANRDPADFAAWTASGVFYGTVIGLGYYFYPLPQQCGAELPATSAVLKNPIFYLIVGVPWMLMAQGAATLVFSALTSYSTGFNADQEWLGRAGGWLLLTAVGWALGMFVVFAGFLHPLTPHFYIVMAYWIVPISGFVGLVIALLGSSSISRFNFGARGIVSILMDVFFNVAASLFLGALIFSISVALDHALFRQDLFAAGPNYMFAGLKTNPPKWLWVLERLTLAFLSCAFLALATSLFININRFSLHALFRNRLVRSFLGASRPRKPDPFTGFDECDDPRMHELWKQRGSNAAAAASESWRPFHIVNLTLNVVSAKRLAWQERKAAPFTVSPLHCGTSSKSAPSTKRESGNVEDCPCGAYRPAELYGGPGGISLGTAMAISGAAANPNMGYHSSPCVTFLMTIFNLRLGWWLGNPGAEGATSYTHDGPKLAILPLLQEILGLTTDNRMYVNLSDGGHFDNLGLYEMVRRRCRFIVISDAGRDPDYTFEDLGNAVRKISIDLGVPIKFHALQSLRRRSLDGSVLAGECHYHAVAEIDYATADRSPKLGVDKGFEVEADEDPDSEADKRPKVENGAILYIKAGYHGTESAGVRSYAMANLDFPHQSTANQWFSESQFESYRSLGFEIMDELLNRTMRESPHYAENPSLENLFAVLLGPSSPIEPRANVYALDQRAG